MAMTSILLPRQGTSLTLLLALWGGPGGRSWARPHSASPARKEPILPATAQASVAAGRSLRPDCSPGGAWIRGSSLHAAFPTH